jgi:hypothetical protein
MVGLFAFCQQRNRVVFVWTVVSLF